MMKKYCFVFWVAFCLFPPGSRADENLITAAAPDLPSGARSFLPDGAKVRRAQQASFRGEGAQDLLICYDSSVEVLGLQQNRWWSLLFRKDFTGPGIDAGVFQPDLQKPTALLCIEQWTGASVGGGLEIYLWKGKGFQKTCGIHLWDLKVEDLGGKGKRVMVCRDRYGPDNILSYENGRVVFANYDYPGYFLAKAKEIENRVDNPNLSVQEKLAEENFGDWLPVFLYTGRLQEGRRVVQALREIAGTAGPLDSRLQRKLDRFEANALILEGNDKAQIRQLKRQVPQVGA
jgi:hypothetical protein